MSTKLFTKDSAILSEKQKEAVRREGATRSYLWEINTGFGDLRELDEQSISKAVQYLTVHETFWEEFGRTFTPGIYEGKGFYVEIEDLAWSHRGSLKDPTKDRKQTVEGRFATITLAISFWDLLCGGDLLPTRPLCKALDLTTENYAKQASLAVTNSAEIRELRSLVDQLMNQINHHGQILQDHVLTPQ